MENTTIVKDFGSAMEAPVTQPTQPQQPIKGVMPPMPEQKQSNTMLIPALLVALVLGVGTGYLLFTQAGSALSMKPATTKTEQTSGTAQTEAAKVVVGKVYGSSDASTFNTSAEGVLLVGGVNGEGSFHIVREGGESQNVYLTSSVVDLNLFVSHKVTVKGETFKAQRAGWLMDVGQVKVLELNAELPDWAKKAAEKAEMKAGSGN